MTLMTSKDLVSKAKEIVKLPTQYLVGGFGCRLGKDWYDTTYSWNKANASLLKTKSNTNPITFGFDCVCLIKGILWGFCGDANKTYGGAVYDKSTDYSVGQMMNTCSDISTDFTKIDEGEFLFLGKSHIGIYIGNGEVIESTPAWKCCVQRTLLPSRNTTNYEKLPVRNWDSHGHSSLIDFGTIDYKTAFENLSAKYGKLEIENFQLTGKLEKIKEILKDA